MFSKWITSISESHYSFHKAQFTTIDAEYQALYVFLAIIEVTCFLQAEIEICNVTVTCR